MANPTNTAAPTRTKTRPAVAASHRRSPSAGPEGITRNPATMLTTAMTANSSPTTAAAPGRSWPVLTCTMARVRRDHQGSTLRPALKNCLPRACERIDISGATAISEQASRQAQDRREQCNHRLDAETGEAERQREQSDDRRQQQGQRRRRPAQDEQDAPADEEDQGLHLKSACAQRDSPSCESHEVRRRRAFAQFERRTTGRLAPHLQRSHTGEPRSTPSAWTSTRVRELAMSHHAPDIDRRTRFRDGGPVAIKRFAIGDAQVGDQIGGHCLDLFLVTSGSIDESRRS